MIIARVVVSSAVIDIQAHRPLYESSGKLRAKKNVNSDHVNCCCVVCRNWDLSASSGKSWVTRYFKVGSELWTDFKGNKFTIHEVFYSKESDISRSDMRGSTILTHISLSLKVVYFQPVVPFTFYIKFDQVAYFQPVVPFTLYIKFDQTRYILISVLILGFM